MGPRCNGNNSSMTGYTFTIQYGLCMNMLSVSSIQNCDFFFDFFFFYCEGSGIIYCFHVSRCVCFLSFTGFNLYEHTGLLLIYMSDIES